MKIISATVLLLVFVSSSEKPLSFGENSQRIRRSLASKKCLRDNPSNAGRPLCFIDGKQVDVCSNTGCKGCCGSQCSWVGTYCNEAEGVVAKCPGGYTQVGTLSENNDIRGGGLGQSEQASIADCKKLCDKDPMCVAFMYGGQSTDGPSTKCELSLSVTPDNSYGTNFRFCRKTVKCLQDNPNNKNRPLCFVNEVHQDTCSNKGCNGCCGSKCSWIKNYCSDRIVAECPTGYKQVGTLSSNNHVKGAGLGITQQDSIGDCQALCESTEGCVAFMYGGYSTVRSQKCELSSTLTPNNSWGTNFRFCQGPKEPNHVSLKLSESSNWSRRFNQRLRYGWYCSGSKQQNWGGLPNEQVVRYGSLDLEVMDAEKQTYRVVSQENNHGIDFGKGSDCYSWTACGAQTKRGGFSIDLRGTGFEIVSSRVVSSGWGKSMYVSQDGAPHEKSSNFALADGTQRVEAMCGGWCGSCKAELVVRKIPDNVEKRTPNVVEERAPRVGGWGGSCTCPDGSVYQVGDNYDYCGSLACHGGISGTCNRKHGEWSYRKVTCGAPLDSNLLNTAFVKGPKQGCEPGYMQPQSAADCKTIAEANGVRYWGGNGHRSGADPRGCIYRTPDQDIYFNTHNKGSTNRGDRRTVCVQAFVQGPKTGCEPGYVQPKTAEECKALAEASNTRYWGGAGHRSGADPRGCIYRTPDRDIYFNTHETGSTNRGDRRTVCVRGD